MRWLSKLDDPSKVVRQMLLGIVLTLVALGTLMIYSASAIYADQMLGDSLFFLKRHLLFLCLGFIFALLFMSIDYKLYRKVANPALIVMVVLLILVLLMPQTVAGTRRWFRIAGMNLQPSEFAKLAVILYIANMVSEKKIPLRDLKFDILPIALPVGLVCGLVLLGKDFGTTVVIGAVFVVLMFLAGLPKRYFLGIFAISAPVLVLAVVLEPYRLKRIVAFMNPWEDILNTGFQLYQSLLAIGAGGLWGAGLGQSQQKLFYLPAAHTDFIFSIIGEELGFLGVGTVILLFVAFAWVCWLIVSRCSTLFGQFLAVGIGSQIILEAIVNIGVSIGVFPTKGLALPFVSYGGSALLVKMIFVGILLNVSRDMKWMPRSSGEVPRPGGTSPNGTSPKDDSSSDLEEASPEPVASPNDLSTDVTLEEERR